jgi:hypothetical protein
VSRPLCWRAGLRFRPVVHPMRSATVAGYESAVTWLSNVIGDEPLTDIKNEVARELIIAMKAAIPPLADKTIVTYFQVVKAVVASVVNKVGEQLHSRNWNLHHIGFQSSTKGSRANPRLQLGKSSRSFREPQAATEFCLLF